MRRSFAAVKHNVSAMAVHNSLWFTCQAFATSAVRLNNSGKINPETARQAAQEDRDELERERKLREQFVNKIHQQYPQYGTSSSGSSSSASNTANAGNPAAGSSSMPPPPPFPGFQQAWKQAWEQAGQQTQGQGGFTPTSTQRIARLFFFAASIYLIMMVSNMRNPNSPLMVLQGLPWWQVPADTMLAFGLIRLLVSVREQRAIKTDFESATRQEPQLGLVQFLNRRYPTVLAGHRTQQAEILAALSACHLATRDFKVSDTIYRVVREKGTRDSKATIDALMEALNVDFPQVFAPQLYAPPPLPHVQQQPYHVAGFAVQQPPPQQGGAATDGVRFDMTSGSSLKSM